MGHTGEGHTTASVGYGGFADKDKASNIEQATQIRSQGLRAGQDSCEVVNKKNDTETGIRLGPSHEKDDTDKTYNMNAFEMDGTLGHAVKIVKCTNRTTSRGVGDSSDSGSPPIIDPTKGSSRKRAASTNISLHRGKLEL